jgi:hypothetical protein
MIYCGVILPSLYPKNQTMNLGIASIFLSIAVCFLLTDKVQAKSQAGCYFSNDHHCECEDIDEASCKTGDVPGLWTEECNCDSGVSTAEQDDAADRKGEKDLPTPDPKEKNAATARWLLREAKWGTLTTASGESITNTGHDSKNPDESQLLFASVLPFASDEATGRIFFYLRNERHFHSATLTVSQAAVNSRLFGVAGCGTSFESVVDAQDPRCGKLSVGGKIHPCSSTDVGERCEEIGLQALLQNHPTMKDWPEDHHFTVHELVPNVDGFWMIADFGGGAQMGGADGYSKVDQEKIVANEIRNGEAIRLPTPEGDGSPASMPRWKHYAERARWVVHESLWATVSTTSVTGESTFGNIRSVVDGVSLASSTGLPFFYTPDVDPTAIAMKAHDMQMVLSFSEAAISARVTAEGQTCASQDVGMPTCAQVVVYGKGVILPEGSPEYNAALLAFKDSHPLAPWLSEGGSHMEGKYYTVEPSRIHILDHFGGSVDVDIEEYLAVSFSANGDNDDAGNLSVPTPTTAILVIGVILGCLCACCGKALWVNAFKFYPGKDYETVSTAMDGMMKTNGGKFYDDLEEDTGSVGDEGETA